MFTSTNKYDIMTIAFGFKIMKLIYGFCFLTGIMFKMKKMNTIINKILCILKNETVLSISVILAVVSMFFIKPDREYPGYIDFRTLALLFCLMAVMSGFQETGVFKLMAGNLIKQIHMLSGFTDNLNPLIIGVNLGGLGTLIASMASLISFKFIGSENKSLRGRYLLYFTGVNVFLLAVLIGVYWIGRII